MRLRQTCEVCGTGFVFSERMIGRVVPCKECGADIEVREPRRERRASRDGTREPDGAAPQRNALLLGLGVGAAVVVVLAIGLAAVFFVVRGKSTSNDAALAQSDGNNPTGGAASGPRRDPLPSGAGFPNPPGTRPSGFGNPTSSTPRTPVPTSPTWPSTSSRPVTGTSPSSSGSSRPSSSTPTTRPSPPASHPSQPPIASPSKPREMVRPTTVDWTVTVDPSKEAYEISAERPISLSVPLAGPKFGVWFAGPYNPYVAVYDDSTKALGVFDLRNETGSGKLRPQMPRPVRLGVDGRHLIAMGDFLRNPGFYVYDAKARKSLGQLTTDHRASSSVDECWFPAADRVAVLDNSNLNVWTLPEGKPLRTVRMSGRTVFDRAFAFSPGGRYLAEGDDSKVRIHDLDDGRVAGEIVDADRDRVAAVAFSPDGRELASLHADFPRPRLEFSSVETGSPEGTVAIDRVDVTKVPTSMKLQWFPDRTRLLLDGRYIVDRAVGNIVHDFGHERHVVFDDARLLTADLVGAALVVKSVPVPNEAIKEALAILKKGGRASDIGLPPLTTADFSGNEKPRLESQALPTGIDIRPAKGIGEVVPAASLPAWPTELRFSDPAAARVVAYYRRSDDGPSRSKRELGKALGGRVVPEDMTAPVRLEAIDLRTGRVVGRLDVPFDCRLLSVDPEGKFAAFEAEKSGGRVDVWSLDDGRHVVGARPVDAESRSTSSLEAAVLVDRDHLLVYERSSTASLWQLPKFRRLHSVRDVPVGTLVPDRSAWLTHHRGRIVARDVLTGDLRAALSDDFHDDFRGHAGSVSPDGTRIVQFGLSYGNGASYRVKNLRDGTATVEFPAVRRAPFQWCGNDHLVQFDSGADYLPGAPDRTTRWEIVVTEPVRNVVVRGYRLQDGYPVSGTNDGLVWYVCRAAPGSDVPVLRNARLPEPDAIAAAPKDPPPDPAIVFSRTDPVALDVQPFSTAGAEDLSARVLARLRESLSASGREVRDGTRAVLHVGFKEAPTGETVVFRPFGGRGANQSFPNVRLEAHLELTVGNEIVWTHDTGSDGVGFGLVTLSEGETVEQHVAKRRGEMIPRLLDYMGLPNFVRRRDAPPPPPPSWRLLTADGVK